MLGKRLIITVRLLGMKYTKISIFSMLCAGTLLSLADTAIGNKDISKVSAATEIANAFSGNKLLKENNNYIVEKYSAMGPNYYEPSVINYFNNLVNDDFLQNPFINFVATRYQEKFLAAIKPKLLQLKSKGILPSIMAAQAALESNYGTSRLAREANNLFSIKGSYNGQTYYIPTREYSPSKGYYVINGQFRKYSSWDESIQDYVDLMTANPRYHNLLFKDNYKDVAHLLKQDGYATDPNYAKALIDLINMYKLYLWDNTATTVEDESIAQIKYIPNYGVLGFYIDGTSIPDSNYKFKDGTRWKTFGSVIINGEEMYNVGGGEYIPKKYTNHNDNGIITIHYQVNYGVNALRSDGTQIPGSNLTFKTGTRWKIVGVKIINGEMCYLVGNDMYIPKRYTQWGEGK